MSNVKLVSGPFSIYVRTDSDDTIVEIEPALKKFTGEPLDQLISWLNSKFKSTEVFQLP